MPTEKEMKLILETVMYLANCTNYRVSMDGKTICDIDDVKDAAAEIVGFMAQIEFGQVVSEDE